MIWEFLTVHVIALFFPNPAAYLTVLEGCPDIFARILSLKCFIKEHWLCINLLFIFNPVRMLLLLFCLEKGLTGGIDIPRITWNLCIVLNWAKNSIYLEANVYYFLFVHPQQLVHCLMPHHKKRSFASIPRFFLNLCLSLPFNYSMEHCGTGILSVSSYFVLKILVYNCYELIRWFIVYVMKNGRPE